MTAKIIKMPNEADRLGVKVGSIFSRSWGYDQTNVNFYVVVEVSPSGKSVKLREVGQAADGEGDRVVPRTDSAWGECGHCEHWIRGDYPDGMIHLSGLKECYDGQHEATPKIYTKRLGRSYQGAASLAWNSYSRAYLWDGKPEYRTTHGGH